TLAGTVGKDSKDFVYEVKFPGKTNGDKAFVEDLWARRKVGYLLDQIRTGGEKKELVDEVLKLAKKHGITTPYTSYLVAPDQAQNVARVPTQPLQFRMHAPIPAPGMPMSAPANVTIINNSTAGGGMPAGQSRIQFAPVFVSPDMQWAVPH